MQLTAKLTREQLRDQRQAAYLEAWPVPQQQEALQDHVSGNSEKWLKMQADFQAIRVRFPYPE